MKRALVVILLLGLVFTVAVRADDDDGSGGSGGSGGAAVAPKAKAKAAAPKAKPKARAPARAPARRPAPRGGARAAPQRRMAPPSRGPGGVPLEALTRLPVEPLAMDAAALRDDDTQFDQLPKQLTGKENVVALTKSLKSAALLLNKMKRDVEGEKVWTKNVYDIIQNYQYKYLKTIQDVKMRQKKIKKMDRLVTLLKQSTLHSAVEKQLGKAEKALGELVTRAEVGDGGKTYKKLSARMAKLKHALNTMKRPTELYSETTNKMKKILKTKLPPKTSDALDRLAGGKGKGKGKGKASKAAKKAAKKAKKGK